MASVTQADAGLDLSIIVNHSHLDRLWGLDEVAKVENLILFLLYLKSEIEVLIVMLII